MWPTREPVIARRECSAVVEIDQNGRRRCRHISSYRIRIVIVTSIILLNWRRLIHVRIVVRIVIVIVVWIVVIIVIAACVVRGSVIVTHVRVGRIVVVISRPVVAYPSPVRVIGISPAPPTPPRTPTPAEAETPTPTPAPSPTPAKAATSPTATPTKSASPSKSTTV